MNLFVSGTKKFKPRHCNVSAFSNANLFASGAEKFRVRGERKLEEEYEMYELFQMRIYLYQVQKNSESEGRANCSRRI